MVREFEKKVAYEYNSRFLKYGAQPKSSLWFSEHRQNLRFDIIIACIKRNQTSRHFSINDIGCGYGGFLKRLQENFSDNRFSYAGFDLAKRPVSYCKLKYANTRVQFHCGSIPKEIAHYNVMSGTFNYAPDLTLRAWKEYLFSSLNSIWGITRNCMVFNLMIGKEEKITSQKIAYIEKETIVTFCQRNFGATSQHLSANLPKEITFSVCKK